MGSVDEASSGGQRRRPAFVPEGVTLPRAICDGCRRGVVIGARREVRFALAPDGDLGSRTTPVAGSWVTDRLCVPCRLAALAPKDRPKATEEMRQLLALRHAHGAPDGAFFQVMTIPGEATKPEWHGFEIELFCVQVRNLPDACPIPSLVVEPVAGDERLEFALYRRSVWLKDLPARLSVRWHHDEGESPLEVPRWDRLNLGELDRLMRGVKVIREVAVGGRPPGSTTWEEADFRERLPRARREFEDRHGRFPAQTELAAEMGISKATLERYKIRWPAGPSGY